MNGSSSACLTRRDPQALVSLTYALAALRAELHEGVAAALERVMPGQALSGGLAALSAEQLGVFGSALAAAAAAGGGAAAAAALYVPSQALRDSYVEAVRARCVVSFSCAGRGVPSGELHLDKVCAG